MPFACFFKARPGAHPAGPGTYKQGLGFVTICSLVAAPTPRAVSKPSGDPLRAACWAILGFFGVSRGFLGPLGASWGLLGFPLFFLPGAAGGEASTHAASIQCCWQGCGQSAARLRPGSGQAADRLRPSNGQASARLRPGCGQSVARLRPGCGQAVARLWPRCGQAAARQRPGCRQAAARQRPGCGQTAARQRRGSGQAAAKLRLGCGQAVARLRAKDADPATPVAVPMSVDAPEDGSDVEEAVP